MSGDEILRLAGQLAHSCNLRRSNISVIIQASSLSPLTDTTYPNDNRVPNSAPRQADPYSSVFFYHAPRPLASPFHEQRYVRRSLFGTGQDGYVIQLVTTEYWLSAKPPVDGIEAVSQSRKLPSSWISE